MRLSALAKWIERQLAKLWQGAREWSGDAAYEKYLQSTARQKAQSRLSATEFYVEQMNRKYSRPNRCC